MSEKASKREWHLYITDMIGFAEKVLTYPDSLDQDDFISHGLTYDAAQLGA